MTLARNSAYLLIISVILLVSLGLVMLSSVSAFAPANGGDALFFIKRQALALLLALIACVIMARWDYHHWIRLGGWMLAIAAVLMLACFLPGLGAGKIKGAHRWLDLGFFNFQPVEALKLAFIAVMAWWFGQHSKTAASFRDGFAIPLGIIAVGVVLCLLQQDLGSSAILVLLGFMIMFVAGVSWRYILPLPLIGLSGILLIALTMPQRRARLMAFLDPEAHKDTVGHQAWQALIAIGSGGLSGIGLGESRQKMFYLPEAHNDFIFPIIGEELGLIVTLGVVLFFLLLCLSGGLISCHAPDTTGMLLGLGITTAIALQAALNIAVVTSMVPTKGIGLPFISYGGSNLLYCFAGLGILLNIHRQAVYGPVKPRSHLPPPQMARM